MIFIQTIIDRPYVFLFLITFLVISYKNKGSVRTLFFLFSGYLIAWISEASSIRNGFPYGWYFYIYENLQGEWLNYGVPVWDSVSYVFLCFAGLSLAEFVSKKLEIRNLKFEIIKLVLLAALFTTLLDVVIDPVAHLGDQWFLGKIYYYPNPGFYFDVPLSNFAGWFLVSFAIVGVNLIFDRVISKAPTPRGAKAGFWVLTGPLLYFGIFLFNWGITLWLGEWWLALCGLGVMVIPVYLFARKLKRS